ncbi:MAG TPA: YafY family protein [Acidimicrobiales bacterium]|nr:YafY family protein [Acidimicrobiales bacterium]
MEGTAGRLLKLLALMQRRTSWTGPDLAQRLGVDVRTVRRDVERLREIGYVVDSTSGVSGCYRLGFGTEMPPLLLDEDEAMAVAVLLGVSASVALPGIEMATLATLARIDRLLPPKLQRQVKALRAATVALARPPTPIPVAELAPLAQACEARELVTFGYNSRGGDKSSRRVEPYRLVAASRVWYLVAYDLDRQDWRTFRVDRVRQVRATGHTFSPRQLDDPAALVAAALSSLGYRYQAEVRVDVAPEVLSRRVPGSVGLVQPYGEVSLLKLGADDVEWLASYLIGLGAPFEVMSPEVLRDTMRELGMRIAAAHRGAEDQAGP